MNSDARAAESKCETTDITDIVSSVSAWHAIC